MVREYVENKGLAHILNKLYFVSERIEDIPWSGLPEECVIKLSNGYYGHVFKRKDAPFDIEKAKKILRNTKREGVVLPSGFLVTYLSMALNLFMYVRN